MITPLMLLTILIALMPTAVLALIYARLPAQVPLHWGITGKPDMIGPKAWLWAVTALLALTPVLLALTQTQRPWLGVVVAGHLALLGVGILALVAGRLNIWVFVGVVLTLTLIIGFSAPQL